jgi:ketosteroid isomerase-like protein
VQADVAAAEARIRALEAEEARALVAGDRAALRRLWAEDFTVNAPRNVVVRGRDGVLALIDTGVIDYARFAREIEVLRVDGDMALVMGWETVHPRGAAPMAGQVVRRRFTNIWRLRGGDWVQVARHAHVVTGG